MITPKEYEYLERRWQELYSQYRKCQKQLNAIDNELQKVEEKLQQPIDNN